VYNIRCRLDKASWLHRSVRDKTEVLKQGLLGQQVTSRMAQVHGCPLAGLGCQHQVVGVWAHPTLASSRLSLRCEFQNHFRVVIVFRGARAMRRIRPAAYACRWARDRTQSCKWSGLFWGVMQSRQVVYQGKCLRPQRRATSRPLRLLLNWKR